MPEVIFPGPDGRLEGRFHPAKDKKAPIALILHPHPQFGGSMNSPICYQLYYNFAKRGFACLRFNFRGVGRSQSTFDHGDGELADAAAALDWAQSLIPDSRGTWIAGFSFGAWIGMQLLMRRPEVEGFLSISAQPNIYDFTFLAPCPSSGAFIQGENDSVSPPSTVHDLMGKVKLQKGTSIDPRVVPGANHFFEGKTDELMEDVRLYLNSRLGDDEQLTAARMAEKQQ